MKFCSSCGTQCEDVANNCPNCGSAFASANTPAYTAYPFDHTAEFSAKDISENKVFAMLCYIFGPVGVIIAAICAKESPYVKFHMGAALKIMIVQILCIFLAIVPVIGWLAAPVCEIICVVLLLIGFFQVCGGKAKDPAIIRGFGFLK